MKTRFLLFIFLLPQFIFGQNILRDISTAEKKGFSTARINPESQAIDNSNFIYHRCEWKVNPAVQYINGKITTYFIPGSAITQLEFDLSDSLICDSVLYHNTTLLFTQIPGDILQITFPSSLPASTLDSVSVFYQGRPPSTGFGSFVSGTHAGTPVMWTLSQPNECKNWWPCKQNLADKIDSVDIIVTCDSNYRAASNGLLVNETFSGSNRIDEWKHRYPIAAYLVCFAVSNYSIYTNLVPFGNDTVKVLNYVYPEDLGIAQLSTPDIIQQMQLYDTLFGEYPFHNEKYGHTECGFGGGMEHQTMTFVGGFSYELLSHELGHHWFGDKVTCASWHDIWLNEGFASYLSGLCYEHYTPTIYWMPFKSGRISYVTSLPDGSVYCPDTLNVNRIFDDRLSYAKGAMILHTLRWVIGDSAWYAAVNNYLNDFAYGFATTTDLKTEFENSSGQNLTWYFNDWYFGQGYPSYDIPWNQDVNNLVTFTVNQVQSDPSVSFFELPLPIEFKNSTWDTIIRFQNNFSGENFSVQLPYHIDSLIFDPEYWIISKNNHAANVHDLAIDPSISIFPNPANDQLFIRTGNIFSGNATTKIYDSEGRLVLSKSFLLAPSISQTEIDISSLDKGFYLMEINAGGKNYFLKFVKE